MSVGRLAGSGTGARGSGAPRERAERAITERTGAERTGAERTGAERTGAEQAAPEGATAGRTADGRTADGRTADGRTADGRTADGRTADGPAAAQDASARGAAAPRRPWGALADPAPNVVVVGSQPGPGPGGTTPARAVAAPDLSQQAPAASAGPAGDSRPAAAPDAGLFARYTRDYVTARAGQQVTILQAGCTTADDDLGVGGLREAGADITVTLIDDDQPVTSAALGADESLGDCVQGDLRTLPLPPRAHDIVLCALLLQRIQHAELVLDRLVATIRPGGLLLLHFVDRDSAAGFLDRVLPSVARRAIWRRRRPGQPGPYPAVYERLSSARGVQAYALMRELVIAERQALGGLAGTLAGPPGFLAAQKLVAWLSRGRLTAVHEELLYVLRKPEDRFARIL
jgi:SAM-dependent methyltransferase